MICRKILAIGMVLLLLQSVSIAQLKLPTFDAELKINQNLLPGDGSRQGHVEFMEATSFYMAGHVQINQYIAIGGIYSRSFRGTAQIKDVGAEKLLLQQRGLDLRFSTGRAKNWRKYIALSYSQYETVQVNESFRYADKSIAYGLNLGIMRRLTNNLYLNVIELGAKMWSGGIWYGTGLHDIFLDAKVGLTYNIGKRK